MKFKIQLSIVSDQGETLSEEVSLIDRSMDANDLAGLSLAESKQLLKVLQQKKVREQALLSSLPKKQADQRHL